MRASNLRIFVLGFLLSATAGKISKGVWNVRSYDNYDVVELEKQFEADWNSVQDPLVWMDNLSGTNSTEEDSSESSDDSVSSDNSVSTSEEYDSTSDSEDSNDFVDSSEETSEDESDSRETKSQRYRGNRYRKRHYRKETEHKNWLYHDRSDTDSFSTSEEYDSTSDSEDSNDFVDSSEETSEDESDSHETKSQRLEGNRYRKRNHRKGRTNSRNIPKRKTWVNRRDDLGHKRRFRNPHGANEQIPHPPKTGRWLRVWQKFNSSKPALAGRWAAMFNRTRKYWNRNKDGDRLEDTASRRERLGQNKGWNLRNHTHHFSQNHTHHNHTHHNHTHPWHSHKNHGLRPIPQRWLVNKVDHVCNYLMSARHNRYMQHKKNNTNSRDYRLEMADQMMICCQKEFEEKLECFGELTRARIDEFCRSNSSVPFRPWKPSQNPRAMSKIKPKCCLPEGEDRYNCFNRTHQIILKRYNMTQPPMEPQEEQVTVEEPQEVEVQEPPVLRTPVGRGRAQNRRQMGRKTRKEHRSSPKQNVKTTCCNLGKEYGAQLDEEGSEVKVCNKLARKLSHKYRPKVICHVAMGRCCIREARTQRKRSTQMDSVMEQEMDAIEEMSRREQEERRYLKITT